jgi:NDP-sugar pyrophosphorylase family protein
MKIEDYCTRFNAEQVGATADMLPWEILRQLPDRLTNLIAQLDSDYEVSDGVAIHKSSKVDPSARIKAPAIVGPNCFIGPNVLLRGGVFLGEGVTVGPTCEVKCVIVCPNSAIAHFNYVGDSIIGSGVDLEAGAMVVNYYNERDDKTVYVFANGEKVDTKATKFGALIGDNTKIGANAVIAPGTILPQGSIVKRLELVDQAVA